MTAILPGLVLSGLTTLCQSAATSMVSAACESLLLVLAVALVLRLAPAATAALRSAAWTAVLLFTAALPVASLLRHHAAPLLQGPPRPHLALHLSPTWSLAVAAFWATASLLRLAFLATGALRLRQLGARATPAPTPALLPRQAILCTSPQIQRPAVLGFFTPRILIPQSLYPALSPSELNQILLHEAEHLRRYDDWRNLFQKLAVALFPLHPALFWVERRLCRERELACDEYVLRATRSPKSYAACLVHLAEQTRLGARLSLELGAWEQRSELARRVHRILTQPNRPLTQPLTRPQAAGFSLSLALGLALVTAAFVQLPPLVSFAPAATVTVARLSPSSPPHASLAELPIHPAGAPHLTLVEAHLPLRTSSSSALPTSSLRQTSPRRRAFSPRTFSRAQLRLPLSRSAGMPFPPPGSPPACSSPCPTTPPPRHPSSPTTPPCPPRPAGSSFNSKHPLPKLKEPPPMSAQTNRLVANSRKAALPTIAAIVLAGGLYFHHDTPVHAAGIAAAAPIDDTSVSALLSLDHAVETIASRVEPAIVNVSVTSRGAEHETADNGSDDGSDSGSGQQQGQQQLPPGFAQFFGPMMPQGRLQPQQQPIEHGIGSGILISPDGYIVTNNHVVDGAMQIKVTLNDRRVLSARVIGTDKLTDLAVIKINATNLPSIPWGDSSQLKPGQTVLAFGSPFGYFQNSVTRGIVSAVNRQNPYSDDARKPGGFIQTDAAINPGNSGGALVDARGELVGINTFIISNSGSFAGAGFAIPAQIAQSVATQIIKNGSVHHGYLGISLNDVTPGNAQFFKLPDATGAIVAQVTPGSPASRAGLANGDVIVSLNGHKILNGSALQVAVSEETPGTHISLGVERNGQPQTVPLTIGEYHASTQVADADTPDGASAGKPGKLGLAVSNLTPDVQQQLHLPAQLQGVAVENVRPGSPAEDAGLTPGDVILEVDRQKTGSATQFVDQVHASPADKDILLLVWSKGNSSYRLLRPDAGSQNGM